MSGLQNFATPQYVFQYFNDHYHYNLDLCAESWSAKCVAYCSLDGVNAFDYRHTGGAVWVNPPYEDIAPWVRLLLGVCGDSGSVGTLLLPARTDQAWFHKYSKLFRVEFIKGRIKFIPPPGWEGQINPKTGKPQKATSAAFPCMAMHFGPNIKPGFRLVEIIK